MFKQNWLMLIAALGLASSAAYFSVFGLAQTFSASYNSMLVIAAFIEFAKVVSIGFLYRNWKIIPWLQKTLNIFLVCVTMMITSIGVAGHLLSSFQAQTMASSTNTTVLSSYEEEMRRIVDRKKQMDDQIAAFPPEFVTGRQRLIESFRSEREYIEDRFEYLSAEIPKLKVQTIQDTGKVGPILFIAEKFGYDTDMAIFILVAMLVLIIDPLAIILMMNANIIKSAGKTSQNVQESQIQLNSENSKEHLSSDIQKILRS